MSTVLNIGIVLSFFLSILLFAKDNKALTDNILSLWLVTIGIHLTGYYINYNGYWELYPHLIGITTPLPFLYGPFLYLYLVYSIRRSSHLKPIDYLHYAPALLSYLYMMPFYFFYSAEEKVAVDKGLINDYSVFSTVLLIGFLVSGIGYSIISYRKLLQHKKMVLDNFSYDSGISLNWLKYAIVAIGLVFITAAIVLVLREAIGFEFPFNADILFYSIIVGFVVFVGYSGIRQEGLFLNTINNEKELVTAGSEYKKSGLKTETAIEKHKELLHLMEAEKPYLNPKLTLNELSLRLEMSANNMSQLINQYEHVNFYDFVNKYRVEEFITRAQSNTDFSLLAHALDSGFNSKSSFNTVFKKLKLETPSQYLANLNKEDAFPKN
ncbi:helix-turn-helix domain-containing protein [Sunxiuqinia sp. sy24]|uniref:helix-turn-helix domain-containing protein n=1 Tax=Sunxiuqinia sp. sy24 TaxID=3461495 RepID=UPI004046143F